MIKGYQGPITAIVTNYVISYLMSWKLQQKPQEFGQIKRGPDVSSPQPLANSHLPCPANRLFNTPPP